MVQSIDSAQLMAPCGIILFISYSVKSPNNHGLNRSMYFNSIREL